MSTLGPVGPPQQPNTSQPGVPPPTAAPPPAGVTGGSGSHKPADPLLPPFLTPDQIAGLDPFGNNQGAPHSNEAAQLRQKIQADSLQGNADLTRELAALQKSAVNATQGAIQRAKLDDKKRKG
jgi:hypothetical protein